MLIITRRPGERLVPRDDIRIELIEIAGSTVRLGVAAPRTADLPAQAPAPRREG